MGTSATVNFRDEYLGKLYHHGTVHHCYDGYVEYMGNALAVFLENTEVINYNAKSDSIRYANGIGCLAAQWVCHTKDGIGNVRLAAENTEADYTYNITLDKNNKLKIEVYKLSEKLFKGTVLQFKKFVKNYK